MNLSNKSVSLLLVAVTVFLVGYDVQAILDGQPAEGFYFYPFAAAAFAWFFHFLARRPRPGVRHG